MGWRRTLAAACLLVGLSLAACGDDDGGPYGRLSREPTPTGFDGRFRAQTEQGPVVLTLREEAGTVHLSMDGETATARVVGPGRAEGEESNEVATTRFVLELQGERLLARFTVVAHDGSGEERRDVLFDRAAPVPSGESRDADLLGHWRHTETHGDARFSYAIDVHLVLAEDGTYASWSKSASSMGVEESPRTTGAWKTSGGVLYLRSDGGDDWQERGRYEVSGATMLLGGRPFERL